MSKTTRATQTLSKAGIAFSVHSYDYDPNAERVGLQAAEALGEDPRRVLKTLMAEVDGKPVCCVVPSDREVSMKKLAAAFGGKSAAMMKPADAERLTGYHVGGISPHKNLGRLVDAFEALSLNPSVADVRLVLVGDYAGDVFHSDYPRLKEQIESLGLSHRVTLTGFVPDDDLVHLYNAAQLLVFPSLEEGFGLPAVEAMACGTPVVASDRGSLPEIVGEAGLLFDPMDAHAIERALESVLRDDDLRAGMAQRGLARSSLFTWENAARRTIAHPEALA